MSYIENDLYGKYWRELIILIVYFLATYEERYKKTIISNQI